MDVFMDGKGVRRITAERDISCTHGNSISDYFICVECMEKFRALERRNRELEAEVAMLRGDGSDLVKCQCKAISE